MPKNYGKIRYSLIALVIAMSAIVIVKANPGIDQTPCPGSASIFYYIGPNPSNPSVSQLNNQKNWMKAAPDEQFGENGINRICAICAFTDNIQRTEPEFSLSQLSGIQLAHTSELLANLIIYANSNSSTADDSIEGFIFEKN